MRSSNYTKGIKTVIFLGAMALPCAALCQALPWQQSAPQPQAGQQMQPAQSPQPMPPQHHHAQKAASSASASSGDTRVQDDTKLNELAGRFYALHEKDANALPKMKTLEKQVSSFTKSLQTKSRGTEADISHDAQHLLDRIQRQRKEWETRASN